MRCQIDQLSTNEPIRDEKLHTNPTLFDGPDFDPKVGHSEEHKEVAMATQQTKAVHVAGFSSLVYSSRETLKHWECNEVRTVIKGNPKLASLFDKKPYRKWPSSWATLAS